MDSTRTYASKARSQGKRVENREQAAQARLAQKSFTDFMRKHNREAGR